MVPLNVSEQSDYVYKPNILTSKPQSKWNTGFNSHYKDLLAEPKDYAKIILDNIPLGRLKYLFTTKIVDCQLTE